METQRRTTLSLRAATTLVVTTAYAIAAFAHRWTHDDGFINLRIVRNLVAGEGPSFNLGERVEASTSTLWIVLLAAVHACGVRPEHAALGLSLALGVAAIALASLCDIHARERDAVPFGILIFVALAPSWQYASSGLETSLALCWLSAALLLRLRRYNALVTSLVLGVGSLVRPDHAIYSALLFAELLWSLEREQRNEWKRAHLCAMFLALPLCVQIARMGMYATLSPNTALAKEAFRANLGQGWAYLRSFMRTYHLYVPLTLLAWAALRSVKQMGTGTLRTYGPQIAISTAACLHVGYLVIIGGDYMHARLLLPDLFALILPLAWMPRNKVPGFLYTLLSGWVVLACVRLRPSVDNVDNIGDEYGWYVRSSAKPHPVRIEDYQGHAFYAERSQLGHERALYGSGFPAPLAPWMQTRVQSALSTGAIGILGYSLPSSVYLADRHGLADPIGARLVLAQRGRPGHEKELTHAWQQARFTESAGSDASDVVAARNALGCEPVRGLLAAVHEPLTPSRFWANIGLAWRHHRLRIPADPFEAEATLCGSPLQVEVHGGTGGGSFTWHCAKGRSPSGIRVSLHPTEQALESVALLCNGVGEKSFGDTKHPRVDLVCPTGTQFSGVFGTHDHWVRSIGALCGEVRTSHVGKEGDVAFSASCKTSTRPAGLAGRSGSLIDAVGVSCPSPSAAP